MYLQKLSKQIAASLLIWVIVLGVFLTEFQPARAISFPVSPPVTISTALANQALVGVSAASCTAGVVFYVFYVDGSATPALWMSSSTDGVTWTSAVSIMTLSPTPSATGTALLTGFNFGMSCNGVNFLIGWLSGSGNAQRLNMRYGALSQSAPGKVTFNPATTGPKSTNGFVINPGTNGYGLFAVRYLNGITFAVLNAGSLASPRIIAENNLAQANFSVGINSGGDITWTGALYVLVTVGVAATQINYMYSSDGITWSTQKSFTAANGGNVAFETAIGSATNQMGPDLIGFGNNAYVFFQENTAACTGGTSGCVEVERIDSGGNTFNTVISGYTSATISYNCFCQSSISDNTGVFVTILDVGATATDFYWVITLSGTSLTVTGGTQTFTGKGSTTVGANKYPFTLSPSYSTALGAFSITSASSAATFEVYTQVFGIVITAAQGTQTIGSCPTKNTATQTLANSTVYYYQGTALGQTVVNSISTFFASDTLAGPTVNTLYLLLYVGSAGVSTVSAANPLVQTASFAFTISKGQVNQAFSGTMHVNILTANTAYAVAIFGTDKMKINQSSLSGLLSASGTTPPVSITTNTANNAQLYLCASANYQFVITSTTTVTSSSTTTTTITGGTITTNSNSPNQSAFWFLPFLYLLFPTGILIAAYVGIKGRRG